MNEQVAERLADTMFALSLPSRVHILVCLRDGPRTVSELMEALGMEQSAVSHQLRVLREHELVAVAREGRLRRYALYDEQPARSWTPLWVTSNVERSRPGAFGRRGATPASPMRLRTCQG